MATRAKQSKVKASTVKRGAKASAIKRKTAAKPKRAAGRGPSGYVLWIDKLGVLMLDSALARDDDTGPHRFVYGELDHIVACVEQLLADEIAPQVALQCITGDVVGSWYDGVQELEPNRLELLVIDGETLVEEIDLRSYVSLRLPSGRRATLHDKRLRTDLSLREVGDMDLRLDVAALRKAVPRVTGRPIAPREALHLDGEVFRYGYTATAPTSLLPWPSFTRPDGAECTTDDIPAVARTDVDVEHRIRRIHLILAAADAESLDAVWNDIPPGATDVTSTSFTLEIGSIAGFATQVLVHTDLESRPAPSFGSAHGVIFATSVGREAETARANIVRVRETLAAAGRGGALEVLFVAGYQNDDAALLVRAIDPDGALLRPILGTLPVTLNFATLCVLQIQQEPVA